MTTKTRIKAHAIPLTMNPVTPSIQNQPGTTFLRLLKRWGRMAVTYDRVERMTKDPTKAEKAVVEPT